MAEATTIAEPADSAPPASSKSDAGIAGAAILNIVALFLSAVTGVALQTVIAARFGVGMRTDAYWQAFRLPSLIYFLVAGGALRTGFVPVFTGYLAAGEREKAWHTFSSLTCIITLFASIVVGLGIVFSRQLAPLVAGGLPADGTQLCGVLMAIMFPAQVFFVLNGLFMGTLNAMNRFVAAAIGPILVNIAVIVAGIWFVPDLDFGIRAVSGALVIGAFVSAIPLCGGDLWRAGAKLRLVIDFKDPGVIRVAALTVPVILGLAIAELNLVIATSLATGVSDGAATILNNADRLTKLPMRMFGAGLAIVLFPSFSYAVARGEWDRLRKQISFGIRNVMFMCAPVTFALVVLREPIIRLVYEWKAFSPEATARTAIVVAWMSLGIFGMALVQIVARAFYSMQDTRTPVVVGVIAVAAGVAGCLLLRGPMGESGLGLGLAISNLTNAILLIILLRKRLNGIDGRAIVTSTLKILIGCALMSAVMYALMLAMEGRFGTAGIVARALATAVPFCAGIVVYAIALLAMKADEAHSAVDMLMRPFRRKKAAA
jgi:putative peptidoglycan lipid II flippase